MAIRYTGDKNLIGYGAAQVYKEADLTKGVKYEQAKGAAKAAAKAKQKADVTTPGPNIRESAPSRTKPSDRLTSVNKLVVRVFFSKLSLIEQLPMQYVRQLRTQTLREPMR